jgi:hypothetical protein
MAVRFLKPGTEVRAAIVLDGRFHHAIVEQVIDQDNLVVRVGRDSGYTVARMTGPSDRPNRFTVSGGD